jgi:hypothetical protein
MTTGNGHGARIRGGSMWNLSGNGHGARVGGDDRWNLSKTVGLGLVVLIAIDS